MAVTGSRLSPTTAATTGSIQSSPLLLLDQL
jgi:hypothetical protein